MTLVFMGTPDFAVPTLERLLASRHRVAAVVTAPDKPAGRGLQHKPSAVKQAALAHGLPLLQPESLEDEAFLRSLRQTGAELFVVVAFRILPEAVLSIPPKGAVNLHASLLPKYRGAAPINWALINGERETGVTTFFIEKKVDTGKILLQQSTPVDDDMTAGELHDLLAQMGADLMLRTVDGIEAGTLQPREQVGEANRDPKLTRELEMIDWRRPARELHNLIRGLSPIPGASMFLRGREIKVLRSQVVASEAAGLPGEVLVADPRSGWVVQTSDGALRLLTVKPEGKKIMSAEEFLRGNRIDCGERL